MKKMKGKSKISISALIKRVRGILFNKLKANWDFSSLEIFDHNPKRQGKHNYISDIISTRTADLALPDFSTIHQVGA